MGYGGAMFDEGAKLIDLGSSSTRSAGVGLKPQHIQEILRSRAQVGFFEIHAENFMGEGGAAHAQLQQLRRDYEVSIHGVALSLGGEEEIDEMHVQRWRRLVERYEPFLVSEHLAWSCHGGACFHDLLPIPYTRETLKRVATRVNKFQDALKRKVLIENPATYVAFDCSAYPEIDFLSELVRSTGCGLLLDVNNVFVSCVNHARDPEAYIDAFPVNHVDEIHLAGFHEDRDEDDARLLIDAHCAPVSDSVWRLYARTLARAGAKPTLIEWDNDVPSWSRLRAQAATADAVMSEVLGEQR